MKKNIFFTLLCQGSGGFRKACPGSARDPIRQWRIAPRLPASSRRGGLYRTSAAGCFTLIIFIGACCSFAATGGNLNEGVSTAGRQKGAVAEPTLILVSSNVSDYVIVVPDAEYPRERVKKAADLLQSIQEESAGCVLPVYKEADAPSGKK